VHTATGPPLEVNDEAPMVCTQRDKLKFLSAGLVHQAQLREDLGKAFNVYMFGASNARPEASAVGHGDVDTCEGQGSCWVSAIEGQEFIA